MTVAALLFPAVGLGSRTRLAPGMLLRLGLRRRGRRGVTATHGPLDSGPVGMVKLPVDFLRHYFVQPVVRPVSVVVVEAPVVSNIAAQTRAVIKRTIHD